MITLGPTLSIVEALLVLQCGETVDLFVGKNVATEDPNLRVECKVGEVIELKTINYLFVATFYFQ